ncbi:hypothetical protein QYE76_009056 [Lolium multiflorum]|uniref:Zinc knuckle CX2CX4HX4C domain-containing protein n=1 Tax=Lolium multiflorum TaxID=4521 RepID=A0AAD8X378_LOLMU|nr:hypothetical protein QYE76_009056 [Lolium multiflorum]
MRSKPSHPPPPHTPVATTIATMEAAAPAEAKRAATGSGREAKPKAAKKVLSPEEKIIEAAKRRGRHKNQKVKTVAAANQQAWQMQIKAGVAQVALHPTLAEGYMLVKREGIAGVAPPASSVSSVSSQLRPRTPAPLQGHPASRFASGLPPVKLTGTAEQLNGAAVPDLNRTPRSGDSCPGATQKTRQVPEESMPQPRILFDEMVPPAPMMDDPDYWKDRHESDIQAIIYGGGFVRGDRAGTGPHDDWAATQDAEDIETARLFATQQTQPTPVSVDDFDDAPTQPDIATKKKGESRRIQGFIDDEDKFLCEAWLATSHDCINRVQQKGKSKAPLHITLCLMIVGKVLSPTKLHISTISAALRPAWGNPRGLLFNPAGDNTFVAEFGSRADKERVVDGPPWVVGKHAVLLKDFDIDQRPQDMVFNRLKIWARIINLPFGYMNKKWGSVIAKPLGVEGSVPVVACDSTGRCWGSFLRVKVEIDTDKPLMRGVTIFSQRRNMTEWFDVQYEQLPRYCFACGILGHSSLECKNPGDRDVDGKLLYSSDRLCPPEEKNKKSQGTRSAADSSSQGHSSQHIHSERPSPMGGTGSSTRQKQQGGEDVAVSSPMKQNKHRGRANQAKGGQNAVKESALAKKDGTTLAGQKRKPHKVYRPVVPPSVEEMPVNSLALTVCPVDLPRETQDAVCVDDHSIDSNKKMRRETSGSADQAGAAEQPCQTQ